MRKEQIRLSADRRGGGGGGFSLSRPSFSAGVSEAFRFPESRGFREFPELSQSMEFSDFPESSEFSGFPGSPGFPGLITLRNANGLTARFTSYGARWVGMQVPDRNGRLDDVILGFDALAGYKSAAEKYHGAIVGRVCGRIAGASFELDGERYALAANDVYGKPQPNHLHGGVLALHNRVWKGRFAVNEAGEESAVFSCLSKDGEEGYPGNLRVQVTYTLRATNALSLVCEAVCDKATPVNLTNHAFFNLEGAEGGNDVLSHTLRLCASRLIECDEELLPTGCLRPVEGSNLDFRSFRMLSDALQSPLFGIPKNKGFSLAFALDQVFGVEEEAGKLSLAAELRAEESGRSLAIYTNQPSIQVYTGYFMDGTDVGKGNTPYFSSAGIALETQGFPDAVHHPGFPSVIVRPGEVYRHVTEYRFGRL